VHLIHHDDTDEQYKLYLTARKQFGVGGPNRIPYTLVPLVFGALNLARRAYDREVKGEEIQVASKKILQFVHQIVTALNETISAVCLRLFLQAAAAADYCRYEAIVYEFMAQAILTYEDYYNIEDGIVGGSLSGRNLSDKGKISFE
jgi:vacuolar protein sorting-associated protein 35